MYACVLLHACCAWFSIALLAAIAQMVFVPPQTRKTNKFECYDSNRFVDPTPRRDWKLHMNPVVDLRAHLFSDRSKIRRSFRFEMSAGTCCSSLLQKFIDCMSVRVHSSGGISAIWLPRKLTDLMTSTLHQGVESSSKGSEESQAALGTCNYGLNLPGKTLSLNLALSSTHELDPAEYWQTTTYAYECPASTAVLLRTCESPQSFMSSTPLERAAANRFCNALAEIPVSMIPVFKCNLSILPAS